jgi:outer membrane protein TolC
VEQALAIIEQNNLTLRAMRQTADAEKLGNRADIALPGPEVGYDYLWGKPSEIGGRTDVSVTQSFDFQTVTGSKSRLATEQNRLVDAQYRIDRTALLLEAKQYCLDMVYYNALIAEYEARLTAARELMAMQKKRMATGDGNQLELNNAAMALARAESEMVRVATERAEVEAQLVRLNNGEALPTITQTQYTEAAMPEDFTVWYDEVAQGSPVLAYAEQAIRVGDKQVALQKLGWLPSISAGYMSEKVTGEHYQGLTVGVSIPLWSTKAKVRQARAERTAAQLRAEDAHQQLRSQLQSLYRKAAGLKMSADIYGDALRDATNATLLRKALDEGQISQVNYLVEMNLYYDAVNQALAAQRDYQKAVAELTAIEL